MTYAVHTLLCICATLITASLVLIALEGSGAHISSGRVGGALFGAAMIGWFVGGQRPKASGE